MQGCWRRLPGRAGGYPPGPPTDPDVRNARIRFLKQSGCCPRKVSCSTVHWLSVIRVGELKVSPLSPASGCSARRRLPSRGSLGPHFPTFAGTMRRYDYPLSLSGASLVARLPDTLPASVCSWCPLRAHGQGGSSQPRQALWSPGPPLRSCGQGDRWLSQVPELPLWLHAPLSDPGGVLDTRHTASRTAAFRRLHTVGFPLDTS